MDLYNTNKTNYNRLGGQMGGNEKNRKKKMHLKKMKSMLPKELLK